MTTKQKIEETRGGSNRRYPFNEIEKGSFLEIPAEDKKAADNIRSAASVYAKTHKIKFTCRTQRNELKQITGVKVYR